MSFASDQVTRLEALLAANAGVQSVTIDGNLVSYADLLKQYDYWKKRAARDAGTRPIAAQIDLSNQ